MAKRKNKKGRTEYLVRWKGYDSDDDTWEPEHHLVNCEEYILEFNRQHSDKQKDGHISRANKHSLNNARKQISRSTNSSLSKSSPRSPGIGKDTDSKSSSQFLSSHQKFRKTSSQPFSSRKTMDLTKSGIKILVPRSPLKNRIVIDGFQDVSSDTFDQMEQNPDSVAPDLAIEKSFGTLLVPGTERARMGTRPRTQPSSPQLPLPVTGAMASSLSFNGKGKCECASIIICFKKSGVFVHAIIITQFHVILLVTS